MPCWHLIIEDHWSVYSAECANIYYTDYSTRIIQHVAYHIEEITRWRCTHSSILHASAWLASTTNAAPRCALDEIDISWIGWNKLWLSRFDREMCPNWWCVDFYGDIIFITSHIMSYPSCMLSKFLFGLDQDSNPWFLINHHMVVLSWLYLSSTITAYTMHSIWLSYETVAHVGCPMLMASLVIYSCVCLISFIIAFSELRYLSIACNCMFCMFLVGYPQTPEPVIPPGRLA